MKKTITVLVSFLLLVNFSCKEKIDFEKEKKAIIAVVEEETAAYYASDFNRWSSTYCQDSTLMVTDVSKSGPYYSFGWKDYSSETKSIIVDKKDYQKEIKIPLRIKIYGDGAYIVFDDETFNDKGESVGKATVACFLEKHDNKWGIVYRNVIRDDSYYQPDTWIINSISYAKSLGKRSEDIARFTGDQFKTGWTGGYNGFANGMLSYWNGLVPKRNLKIIEQDSNHVVFNVNNLFTGLKTTPLFNVTYDDYMTMLNITCQKIADYLGIMYKQEPSPDGERVTISKK